MDPNDPKNPLNAKNLTILLALRLTEFPKSQDKWELACRQAVEKVLSPDRPYHIGPKLRQMFMGLKGAVKPEVWLAVIPDAITLAKAFVVDDPDKTASVLTRLNLLDASELDNAVRLLAVNRVKTHGRHQTDSAAAHR